MLNYSNLVLKLTDRSLRYCIIFVIMLIKSKFSPKIDSMNVILLNLQNRGSTLSLDKRIAEYPY
jgi:hypothetical protein